MDKIIPSFKDSLFSNFVDVIGDISEVGIDSLLDNDLFKDFPIVGFLIGVTKTTQNIHDRNLLRQTLNFIKQFNSGKIDADRLQKYRDKINNDEKKAEEELGRVLIILNNNVEVQKSTMLANLFRNYINGKLTWSEFCEFSEIVRMIFINDVKYLGGIYSGQVKDTTDMLLYPIDRLASLGLVNTTMKSTRMSNKNFRADKYVNLSLIGSKFYQSIMFN